jgi:nucleoside-diphosphate-sugar epimerase
MKVLVTGGAGQVGKATTERLVRQGWEVRVIGLETGLEIPGAEFITCDITNYDDLRPHLRGCQAVIHLAAIRGPQLAAGPKVFEVNTSGTFNVFEAAAAEGIRRVVQASSINALGCAFNLTDMALEYFPIDEAHPLSTTDPYSFSKQVVEEIGRYYWRREGISSVALRFPGVVPGGRPDTEEFRQRRQVIWQTLDELSALPAAERQARLAAMRQRILEWRKARPWEFKDGVPEPVARKSTEDPLFYMYALDRFNLWAFVDSRDAAQSLEKGVTASYEGAHTLFVNSDHNWLGYDSKALVRLFFPEISESKVALSGAASLVSIERARRLIGFEPEF